MNSLSMNYTIVSMSQVLTIDLSQYSLIIIGDDQPQSFYNNYALAETKIEGYIQDGGVVVFQAVDDGWQYGHLQVDLPGDVKREPHWSESSSTGFYYDWYNYIADYSSPIVTAELSDKISLTNEDLHAYQISLCEFTESSLPSGSNVIFRGTRTGKPTLVEYPYGSGIVIATGLTWGFFWDNIYHRDINVTFSRKALDDLYLYAATLTNIVQPVIEDIYLPSNVLPIDYSDEYRGFDFNKASKTYTESGRNMITGDYSDQVGDLKIDGPGPGLQLIRTYNSGAGFEATDIGSGWRLNYDSSVTELVSKGIVTVGSLNIRQKPWGKVIKTVSRNTIFEYINKNIKASDGSLWHQIKCEGGVTGYVYAAYVTEITPGGVKVTYGSGTGAVYDKKEKDGQATYNPYYGNHDILTNNQTGAYTITKQDQTKYVYSHAVGLVFKLTSIEDTNGNKVTINYNTQHKIQSVVDDVGRSLIFTYPDTTHVVVAELGVDAESRIVRYVLDENKNLVETVNPEGDSLKYTYHTGTLSNGEKFSRLKTVTNEENKLIVENYYDSYGRLIKQRDTNNNVEYHIYKKGDNANEQKSYIVDKLKRQSQIDFNTITKVPVKEVDAEGRITSHNFSINYTTGWKNINSFTQDEWDKIVVKSNWEEREDKTDRNGNYQNIWKSSKGNITKVLNSDLSTSEYMYDDKNNVTMEKDEVGNKTFYVYDENSNLKKKVEPLNGTDEYVDGTSDISKFAISTIDTYDDGEAGYVIKGLIRSVTDPNGNVKNFTYDANGNLLTESDPETNLVTTYRFNNRGWNESVTTQKQNVTNSTYDKMGRVLSVSRHNSEANADETTYIVYDKTGKKIKEVSPEMYDASFVTMNQGTYDYNGALYMEYQYYDTGKLWKVTDAENNTTEYSYDVYGNMVTEKKPNNSIYIYNYDSMDRVTKLSFKKDVNAEAVVLEEYSYQVIDEKVATGTNKTQKTQKTYLSYKDDTDIAITTYKYDYAGRLIEKKNPAVGGVITTTAINYYADGKAKETIDGKGNITYFKYDQYDTLKGVRYDDKWTPAVIVSGVTNYNYSRTDYDSSGRKIAEITSKDLVNSGQIPTSWITLSYEYYKNGKLKNVKLDGITKSEYMYDDDGNLSQEDTYTDATNKNITEYNYNYLGKPSEKKVHVRAGDIDGNDYSSTTDTILTTTYTYDKNGNLETVTMPDNVTTTYTYDNMNNQTGVRQPGIDEHEIAVNIASSTQYDWQGNPVTATDANGNVTKYSYNQRGFLETTTLESTTGAAISVTKFYYDRAGRKIAEVAPKDYDPAKTLDQMNRVQYTYDLMGRVKTKTYVGEEKKLDPTTFEWTTQQVNIIQKAYKYDSNGNLTKELDALGFEAATDKTSIDTQINTGYGTEYTYNLANKLETTLDSESKLRGLNFTTKYSYDALGRKTSEINAKGVITNYYYDDMGNVTEIKVKKTASDPEQTIKTNTYDFIGNLLTQIEGNGNATTFEYNTLGKVRKAIYPGDASIPQNTVTYQYDIMGRLKTQQDTKGAVETYTYNNQGSILSYTQRKQDNTYIITTTSKYDRNGNVRFATDGNEKLTEYTYNALNKVKTSKQTVSGVVRETIYDYDANGYQTTVTDWLGNINTNVYDSLNRLIGKKDAYGKSIQKLEYNHNNAQEKSYDALNNYTSYTYDKNNRLLTTIDSENHITSQTYDNVGNIYTKTDGRGNVTPADGKIHYTTYTYDEFNRLSTVKNAKNETTSYTYDLNGNMLTQTDGKGNITTYEYNVANKITKKIDQGGRTGTPGNYTYNPAKTETYTYNADGSLATKTDRNSNTTNYTYDIHGRLLSQTTGNTTLSFTYDANGNQHTMTDSTGTTTRTYDELNRVLTKNVPNIGTTIFQYDTITDMEIGCWAETSTDPKGNETQKTYDRVGRLKTVIAEGKTTTYNYLDNGARQNAIYQSGAREDYTYYKDGLLWTLTNKKANGGQIDQYTYTYDAAHNQTSKVDAKGTTIYTYDTLNRLETVTEPSGIKTTYTYDTAGNRETETILQGTNTTQNTYSYNEQNRLMQVTTKQNGTLATTTVYAYDNNGNQTTTTVNGTLTVTNTYDNQNQLIRTVASGTTVENGYNGDGYRIEKKVNGALTRYLYEYDKVVLEIDGSGNQTGRNVYGSNLLMRTADGTSYYYMYNGHADVTALLKPDGTIAATYYYDAFGNITDTTGSANNSITFAGYQYDKETGLYYLNARMYDPKTARFLQEDTYTGDRNDPLSLNLYAYCHNEPLMYSDPTGHIEVHDSTGRIRFSSDWQADSEYTRNPKKYIKEKVYANEISQLKKLDDENHKYMPSEFKQQARNYYSKKINDQDTIADRIKENTVRNYNWAIYSKSLYKGTGKTETLEDEENRKWNEAHDLGSYLDAEWSSVKYSADQFGKLIDPRPSSGWSGESLQIKKEVATTAVMMAIFHKIDSIATGATGATVSESEAIATRQPLKVNLQLFGGKGTASTAKGWKVGDPIDNITRAGNQPSWSTVKSRYWKNESTNYPDLYSNENLNLMKNGRAPLHEDFNVPKELHHIDGRNILNANNINNLKPVWPWEHADIDPFRYYNGSRP